MVPVNLWLGKLDKQNMSNKGGKKNIPDNSLLQALE
jgi:hypothetical protein